MATDKKYEFSGGISLAVLNNYLSRAINYCISYDTFGYNEAAFKEAIRFITNVGAKYIQRAYGEWSPEIKYEAIYPKLKENLAEIHKIDPDVIFEAAVFECLSENITGIPIPPYVFEAFGLPVETRNFNDELCYFEDGYSKDKHGKGFHAPDVTKLETQMFYYYKATKYIDLGYEAIHFGQTLMTGRFDTDFKCWTKVITMVREYAKTHARRGYVIINSHDHGKLINCNTGHFLVDFIMAPMRAHAPKGSVKHLASEDNPQRCIIEKGWWGDSPYQAGYKGTSPCGEYTEHYPYMVEFDNYGDGRPGDVGDPESYVWGFDEASWYRAQPQWYRKEFVQYLLSTIDSFNEGGHLSLMGRRYGTWYANSKKYWEYGVGDEDWIKEIFQNR